MAGALKTKPRFTPCKRCGGEIFRSSFHNFGEIMIAPFLLPFRCANCGWRQLRFSLSRVGDRRKYQRVTHDRQV